MSIKVELNGIEFNCSRDNEKIIEELKQDIREYGEDFQAYGITRMMPFKVPFLDNQYIFVEVFEDYQFTKEDIELFDDEKCYPDTLNNLLQRAIKENGVY